MGFHLGLAIYFIAFWGAVYWPGVGACDTSRNLLSFSVYQTLNTPSEFMLCLQISLYIFTFKGQHFCLNAESGKWHCVALEEDWRGFFQCVLLQTYPEKPYELMENLDLSQRVWLLYWLPVNGWIIRWQQTAEMYMRAAVARGLGE